MWQFADVGWDGLRRGRRFREPACPRGQGAGDHRRSAPDGSDQPFLRNPRSRIDGGCATRSPKFKSRRRFTTPGRFSLKPNSCFRFPTRRPSRTLCSWSTAASCRAGCSQRRGPAHLRRHRPVEARPGPPRIHGPRTFSYQRVSHPPGADRKVTMRYTQLCRRERDLVEFAYPLSTQKFTSKPIQRLNVKVSIEGREAIKSIYCPSDDAHRPLWRPRGQRVDGAPGVVPARDFVWFTPSPKGAFAANVMSYRPTASDDGYFLLLASPEVKPADAPAAEDGYFRDRPLRLDGWQEN